MRNISKFLQGSFKILVFLFLSPNLDCQPFMNGKPRHRVKSWPFFSLCQVINMPDFIFTLRLHITFLELEIPFGIKMLFSCLAPAGQYLSSYRNERISRSQISSSLHFRPSLFIPLQNDSWESERNRKAWRFLLSEFHLRASALQVCSKTKLLA